MRVTSPPLMVLLLMFGCGNANNESSADAALPDAALPDALPPDAAPPDAAVIDGPVLDAWVPPGDGGFPAPSGTHYKFVVDELRVPTSAAQSKMYGLNIDLDPRGRPDNAMASILSALASQSSTDLQLHMNTTVDRGHWIGLVNVQTDALTSAEDVGGWWLTGETPSPSACDGATDTTCRRHLSGAAGFEISTANPSEALMVGELSAGRLRAGPTTGRIELPVLLFFSDKTVILPVMGARMDIGVVSENSLATGVIGGGIRDTDVQSIFLPALAVEFNAAVATCPGPDGSSPCGCPGGSSANNIQAIVDADDNCQITLTEVQDSSLIASLLAPDVDLFDATGAFNPGVDGIKDAISIGYGFTAVPASFTDPQ